MATVSSYATANDFYKLKSTAFQSNGYWTGPHENISIATLVLNIDGTGTICQDYKGVAQLSSVKKVDDKIYNEDGRFWKFDGDGVESIALEYRDGGKYILTPDTDLKSATPACAEELKKQA